MYSKKNVFRLIFNIFIFILLIGFFTNLSFANSGNIREDNREKDKTIKELKEDIEILKSKKVINFSIFEKFKIEHGELQNYFSKNLISDNLSEIEVIISSYKIDKEIIKKDYNNKINKLLDLEIKFYNSLLPYIDKENINSYNIFVEKSISTIKKEGEIKTKIKDNKKEIEKKVSTIKDKIEENNKKQEEKLNILIETKIKNKILNFKNSKKIENLGKEKQIILFNLVLEKILNKKQEIKSLTPKQENLYSIIEKVIIEVIDEL